MGGADEKAVPVRTKAVLIDPDSMTVVWMNEPAARDLGEGAASALPEVRIDQVVPMAETLGVAAALRAVADTGESQHLQANLVSTSKGRMAQVVSIHRLPGGKLLVLTENTWVAGHSDTTEGAPRRPGRRRG